MTPSLSFITGTTAVALPRTARRAAPARNHDLVVLGHDLVEHRVYVLERYRRSRRLPQIFALPTRGRQRGRLLPLHRWYMGNADEVRARFIPRLEALRRRLVPLVAMEHSDVRLSTRVLRRRAVQLRRDSLPVRRYDLHLAVRPAVDEGSVLPICGSATVAAFLRPRAHLERVLAGRSADFLVAVVSYVGLPYELGLDKRIAILVPLSREPALDPPLTPG